MVSLPPIVKGGSNRGEIRNVSSCLYHDNRHRPPGPLPAARRRRPHRGHRRRGEHRHRTANSRSGNQDAPARGLARVAVVVEPGVPAERQGDPARRGVGGAPGRRTRASKSNAQPRGLRQGRRRHAHQPLPGRAGQRGEGHERV